MAKRKYSWEVKRDFVKRYLESGYSSRRHFADANKLCQSQFNRWCLRYEPALKGKPIFSQAVVVDNTRVNAEDSSTSKDKIQLKLTYGDHVNINLEIMQHTIVSFFRRFS